jgi:hypothetical protein
MMDLMIESEREKREERERGGMKRRLRCGGINEF